MFAADDANSIENSTLSASLHKMRALLFSPWKRELFSITRKIKKAAENLDADMQ